MKLFGLKNSSRIELMDDGNGENAPAKRTRFALREPLKLGDGELPGPVVEVLTPHQLEGIRFIHRGVKQVSYKISMTFECLFISSRFQNKGVILNDESGLGKTHQIVGYLSATVGLAADKTAILCDSAERVHHWLYHLELLTEFRTLILGEEGESGECLVCCISTGLVEDLLLQTLCILITADRYYQIKNLH